MRLVPALVWTVDGDRAETLDPRLLPLLEAIAARHSLAAAVAERGISYRAAWGLLREYERRLGAGLVLLERGRGASLTALGATLVEAQGVANRRLAGVLPALGIDIAATSPATPRRRLRLAASHDLALAALAAALPGASGLTLEVSLMGSLHALEAFARGDVEAAGFHVPIGLPSFDRRPFLRSLRARTHRLLRFADREQGLILPRGNPARVRNLRDVASRRLRFVNRQRGSGTRLLIEQVLHNARIDPARLTGYATEEFTHAAVAATVASGGADVGFGLRAAAAEYQLAFVPLVRERYFLAVRAADMTSEPLRRLAEALAGPLFQRVAGSLAGYDIAEAGSAHPVSSLAASD